METNPIISLKPLGFTWPVKNPFLFCAHHNDKYPAGNEFFGPNASLAGRDIGQDFVIKDGWRMYHGDVVPGFPVHPHRGFETVTIVQTGMVDHSDSHGQAGRYGGGDVQWMTAGAGLQHSEMFPLLNTEAENPLELFQVWLNLPKAKKFAEPHFKMLWAEEIPVVFYTNELGKSVSIKIVAGSVNSIKALDPAPDSWAANVDNEVAILVIKMDASAICNLPAAGNGVGRNLYYHKGGFVTINGVKIESNQAIEVLPNAKLTIENGTAESHILLLQGKPINEPIVQYGPFVMNTQAEIQQAYTDYQKTGFGGWPWARRDQVHPRNKGRFAKYRDGREESPGEI